MEKRANIIIRLKRVQGGKDVYRAKGLKSTKPEEINIIHVLARSGRFHIVFSKEQLDKAEQEWVEKGILFGRIFLRQEREGASREWDQGKQYFCFKKERVFVEEKGADSSFEKGEHCEGTEEKHDCSKAKACLSV